MSHRGEEQTIDIKFVDVNTKETGSVVGSYYTHPAFTFGEEELPGFWVGKFESSADTSSACYTSPSVANCNKNNILPRILPNVNSLKYQTVSNEFVASLKFAGGTQSGSSVTFAGNSTYGLTSVADSHMMKNIEWGATAYLSHSVYGINDEIRLNNYIQTSSPYRTLTGCGAGVPNQDMNSVCGITYGSTSVYPQSTTGNISGIFDMSGGAFESVMGNLGSSIKNAGFSTLPENKYIDIYSSSIFVGDNTTNMTFCTLATCGGHALNETYMWYYDYPNFVLSSHPWLKRGGVYGYDWSAGVFSAGNSGGLSDSSNSWRSVLVAR